MQTHLVTGYKGSEHIKSADQGSFNAAFFGSGQFVMEMGNQFEGSIVNNNTVRILDGDILMYGRHIRIDPGTFEDLTIETGNAGKNRIDLVCMTYEKNTSDGTEKAYLEVLKGSETEGTPSAPEYTDGNIITGAIKNQMPLYKLTVNGVVLQDITPLFKTIPTYKTLAEQYAAQFQKACDTYLGALNILDTMEEVNANTQANQLAGALAVKQGISELNTKLSSIVIIKSVKIYAATTIAAGQGADIYFSVPTVKNYKCVLGIGGTSSTGFAIPVRASDVPRSDGTLRLYYKNISSGTITVNDLYCNMIFVRH